MSSSSGVLQSLFRRVLTLYVRKIHRVEIFLRLCLVGLLREYNLASAKVPYKLTSAFHAVNGYTAHNACLMSVFGGYEHILEASFFREQNHGQNTVDRSYVSVQ